MVEIMASLSPEVIYRSIVESTDNSRYLGLEHSCHESKKISGIDRLL